VIRLKQRKGQRRGKKKNARAIVVIPVAEPLKAALDSARAARLAAKVTPLNLEDEAICLNSEGEPWREGPASAGSSPCSARPRRPSAICAAPSHPAGAVGLHSPRNLFHHRAQPRRGERDPGGALPATWDPAIAWNAIRKLEAAGWNSGAQARWRILIS
jgi:hypothetical protein